jgi:hypothetical protein
MSECTWYWNVSKQVWSITSLRGLFARSNPVKLSLRIVSLHCVISLDCFACGSQWRKRRRHIRIYTSLKCQQASLKFHVIARAFRPKQSNKVISSHSIIALCYFSGLLRLRLAMTETPATSQNIHIIEMSASKPEVSRHCEGFSPEAIQ